MQPSRRPSWPAEAENPVRDRVTDAEWNARVDLAAFYRVVAHHGWTDTIYNHISLRVPDEDAFLLNPFGLAYDEITASSLVKVDIDGNPIDDPLGMSSNPAGFVIHSAIHAARDEAHCIIHTHTPAGIGVAAQAGGLLPISQHAAMLSGKIAYHDFEGVATRDDEKVRLVEHLGDKSILILRNHGLLVAGRTVGEAYFWMSTLELACRAQIAAQSGGGELLTISEESIRETQELIAKSGGTFARDQAAMLRLADRLDPGFRD